MGSNGQLAADLMLTVPDDVRIIPISRFEWDLSSREIDSSLSSVRFDFLINTAAITNVDYCEANPEEAFLVNDFAVSNMIKLCEANNARFFQVSTDFVFDGRIDRGMSYDENGITGPINTYGATKLNSEIRLSNSRLNYCIVRTSSLYGHKGSNLKGGNFVSKVLDKLVKNEEISIVDDIIMSPTNTADLARAIWDLFGEEGASGIFHLTNEGCCSWYEFGLAVANISGHGSESIYPVKSDFSNIAKRPRNSSLSTIRGYEMDHWKSSLERHILSS